MFIYKGHMGGLYSSNEYLTDTYCEQCGDSDWYLGNVESKEEVWNLLKDDTDIDGSGGWNFEYVQGFIDGLDLETY